LTNIAEAAVALFSDNVDAELTARGAGELDRARAAAAATQSLLTAPAAMAAFFPDQVRTAIRRRRTAISDDTTGPMMAVAFVDLVGYTALSTRVPMAELAVALGRFETAAWDLATRHGGRVVKLVGDEAMLVAATAADAVEIALGLCATVAADPMLDTARGAVAWGPVLQRMGDYFGPLVNLAARATKAAAPGRVVVTTNAGAELGPGFAVGPAVPHELRGIDEPVQLAAVARA
jgi:adenylate cyclase